MWARAYRDQAYHAAINTTNGVESLNKVLKYSYLPRKRNINLSRLVTILYEDFIPESHNKYMFLNYHASSTYRSYNNFVPEYLNGRPRQVILHCLERKSNSRKYSEEDILNRDTVKGIFTITGSSGKVHTVDFGQETGQPACTCPDWIQWHLPCKHFFCVFGMVEGLEWESLPESYKSSPHLTTTQPQAHPNVNVEVADDPSLPDPIQDEDFALPQDLASLHDLPMKNVIELLIVTKKLYTICCICTYVPSAHEQLHIFSIVAVLHYTRC